MRKSTVKIGTKTRKNVATESSAAESRGRLRIFEALVDGRQDDRHDDRDDDDQNKRLEYFPKEKEHGGHDEKEEPLLDGHVGWLGRHRGSRRL